MSRPISEDIFRVRMFVSKGYRRIQCSSCKSYFWSLRDRERCGDAPCEPYTFFNIPIKRSLSFKEARDLFLKFFEKHGHRVIEPQPVVARWREDLYLTIASIVVFQPHVTSGIVPPPANPLVIAQPCIRLEDIDSVGLTFGRHLTNFTMGGHHAFNYPDKYVYWTNETVEYAKQFFVEELGIPEEEITFKESWWEGGGNAGPCFEVSIGGLEVATLVFMQYKIVNGKYEEIPIKIVDTGYGIERIAWLSSKTPTAFHAVYSDLVDRFKKILNVEEPKPDTLREIVVLSATLDHHDPKFIDNLVDKASVVVGIERRELQNLLRRLFDMYALLDHTKTIALMLADGIVPSNTGEGYLARLVIRRAMRKLSLLKTDVSLVDLVKEQISYWHTLYPQMYRNREYILEVLELEERRYREVLKRVSTIVPKFLKREPSLEDLITLYDSQGIPPEILKEELEKRGRSITIPTNFYSIVASRHAKPAVVREFEKRKLPDEVVSWLGSFPETRRLFHEDPYLRRFKAKVLGVYKNYIVLDQTAFYPEGGGQLGDSGYLIVDGRKIRIIDTQKHGDVVVHIAEDNVENMLREGAIVEGEIDWSKRYRRMRHHTATHIILGAIRRVLGDHIWQAGAEKTEFKARLDVTHYKMPSKDEIEKIERLANEVVDNALPVRVHYVLRNEAEKIYGLRIYQGGVPLTNILRIVEIPNWDAEACFGTHVSNTSEVGGIRIVNVERIADGVVRFEFVASTALRDYTNDIVSRLERVSSILGSSPDLVDRKAEQILNQVESLKKLMKYYRSKYLEMILTDISRNRLVLGPINAYLYIQEVDDEELLREILLKSISIDPKMVILGIMPRDNRSIIEISLGSEATKYLDAKEILKQISMLIPVKGGGKKDHVMARSDLDIESVRKAIEPKLHDILSSLLRERSEKR